MDIGSRVVTEYGLGTIEDEETHPDYTEKRFGVKLDDDPFGLPFDGDLFYFFEGRMEKA